MKLIASDYDGTLCHNRVVSDHDKKALQLWKNCGNLFGVVTGRSLDSIWNEAQFQGFSADFWICNNGAALFDAELQPLSETLMSLPMVYELFSMLQKFGGEHVAISSKGRRFSFLLPGMKDVGWGPLNFSFDQVETLPEITQVDTHFESDSDAHVFAEAVNRELGSAVHAYPNGICVDIVASQIGKATGLHQYLKVTGISHECESIIAVGDNYNDLSMLQTFDGRLMENAPEELHRMGFKTCRSIAELIEMETAY